jgi:ribonuclease P protein component
MLSSNNRLKKKINFARIEIDGKLFQSKSFGVGIYNRSDSDPSHFGFIISTKISKKAVVRNKIKRIIADRIRLNLNKTKKGLDVLFLVKPSIMKVGKQSLETEVEDMVKKLL